MSLHQLPPTYGITSLFPFLPTHIPYVIATSPTLGWSLSLSLLWSVAVTWLHYHTICIEASVLTTPEVVSHTGLSPRAMAHLASWASHAEGKGAQQVMASLVGVLSLLLAFRSNSALARWEAAGKHWTGVLATSRSILRIIGATFTVWDGTGGATNESVDGEEAAVPRRWESCEGEVLETDGQSLLRLVPCFSLALFHQLQGRRLEFIGAMKSDGSRSIVVEDGRESKAVAQSLAIDYEAPQTMYSLLPIGFVRKKLQKASRSAEGYQRSVPVEVDGSDATTPVSQDTESRREALLGQNIEHAEQLAEKARPQSARLSLQPQRAVGTNLQRISIQSNNLAGEILMEMQRLLSRLNKGLPDVNAGAKTQARRPLVFPTSIIGAKGEPKQLDAEGAPGASQLGEHEEPARSEADNASSGNRKTKSFGSDQCSSSDDSPKLATPLFAHCVGLLNSLSNQQAELEQLRDLPMPAILSSHLHLLLNLHIILQPLLIVPIFLPLPSPSFNKGDKEFGAISIPSIVLGILLPVICTGILLTLHAIAESLAQPFGTGRVKMPMVRWMVEVVREWREVQMQE